MAEHVGEIVNLPRREQRPAERPLPHNAQVERAILASMVQDAAACAKALELLRREHFHDQRLGWLFFAAAQLQARLTPVGVATLEAWLSEREALNAAGGAELVRSLRDDLPEAEHVEAHALIVVELWERREVALACRRAEATACGPVEAWEESKAGLRRDLGRVTAPRTKLEGRPIGLAAEEARAQIGQAGASTGLAYPHRRVADMMGPMVEGELTILCGPSEHGKTTLALEVAYGVASTPVDALGFGEAVYILTGEMPRAKLLLRWACSRCALDVRRVRAGECEPGEVERLTRELHYLSSLPIIIDDERGSAETIARRVAGRQKSFAAGRERTHEGRDVQGNRIGGELLPRCRLRHVIGDHIGLLWKHEQGGSKFDQMGAVAIQWHQQIAEALGVHAMLLSQVRAPNEQERKASPNFPPWPTADSLFGAPNEIKSVADSVIAVQRPERFKLSQNDRKRWRGIAMALALKRRFSGEGDRVALRFDRGAFVDDLPEAERLAFEDA